MIIKEMGCEVLEWFTLAQDSLHDSYGHGNETSGFRIDQDH
jgi:hypothetical protein